MLKVPKDIQLYVTPLGRIPFEEWLNHLKNIQHRALIRLRLDRLAMGNTGSYRALGENLFELKIHVGPGYRVYFGVNNNIFIVLLCGGDKNTQKRDILKAKKYWKQYWSQ